MGDDVDFNDMSDGAMGENFDEDEEEPSAGAYEPHKEGEEKDITSDGGVKKLLVKAGEGYEKPEKDDEVSVHYTGTLLDGTQFDSSRDRGEPFTFKLGQGQVIKGWDKGVATMKKGERAILTCAPEYAYGKAGSPPSIPPDSTLKFDVELLSWTSVKDICRDGGVLKKVVKEGKKWEKPRELDQVTVKYEVRLTDGGKVVAKSPEEGVEFYVKEGHLIRAIPAAVPHMHKGEVALLTVRPDYGFGEGGREAEPSVPPNASLTVDLELVGWKTVENVTDDGQVVKKVLKEGTGYEKPNEGATVNVKLLGTLEDGSVFESRGVDEGDELLTFVTGEEQVIPGLDKAVLLMKNEEKAVITVGPEYGYGATEYRGNKGVVPPNSKLTFEVDMVSFVKEKESWDMDNAEKVETAAKRKEEGNALFKAGKIVRASKKYEKAVKLIDYDSSFDDEQKKVAKALKIACNLNNAACKLKLKQFNETVKLCSKVLESDSQNVKALYRRAQAYMGADDLDLAEYDLKKATDIDPENRDVKLAVRELKRRQRVQNQQEAKLYGNMFARLSKMEEMEAKESKASDNDMKVDAPPPAVPVA
ncbi:hypothetical protein CBR_g29656 [Chara braunii]|uniref:peptidylprolyl isomerase n=1 Tax=Chara braunii TaxID=69332 RepID=A0A388LB20_CHABU|nr:hypothetical protein CBR_g29656 [Chara braunii]|eukprot:GBG79509.1 hypothetical protein CBR_g29656 [Chara braunii]